MKKSFFFKTYLQDKKRFRWGRTIALVIAVAIVIKLIMTGVGNHIGRDLRPDTSYAYLDSLSAEQMDNYKNIIVILADDMGYGDISAFGSELISTPNLDQMAEEGVALTNYYAPAPNCTPSRAGLLTGRYPVRTHAVLPFVDSSDLSFKLGNLAMHATDSLSYGMEEIAKDEVLLNEVLNQYDYSTALIGKWHLGYSEGMRPNDHGFDYFYGALYSNDITPYEIYRNEEVVIEAPANQETLTKEMTDEVVSFIEENSDKPFFLYYASPFPHDPAHASEAFQGTSGAGVYGDSVQELDWSIGEIMTTLEEEEIDDETLVIFTSDNGPWFEGSTEGYRGRKSTLFSGGYKVPFIAWMPGVIEEGVELGGLASGMDIFPTVLELLDIPLPEDRVIDGISMLDYLKGDGDTYRDELFLFFGKDMQAYISNPYKYWPDGSDITGFTAAPAAKEEFLFDLESDPGESYNIAMYNRDLAGELDDKMTAMMASLEENLRGWK